MTPVGSSVSPHHNHENKLRIRWCTLPLKETSDRKSIAESRFNSKSFIYNHDTSTSILCRESLNDGAPPMRGFLALLWITLFFYPFVQIINFPNCLEGLRSMNLLRTSFAEPIVLLAYIAILSAYPIICIPYQRLLQYRFLDSKIYLNRFVSRQVIQVVPVAISLVVSLFRNWPPMQTFIVMMISLLLMIKIHAFLAANENFDQQYQERNSKVNSNKMVPRQNIRNSTETVLACVITKAEPKNEVCTYPTNVTVTNIFQFIAFPTLIYSLEYRRTEQIRWSFLAERTFGVIVIGTMLYVTLEVHMVPRIAALPRILRLIDIADLVAPSIAFILLVFFLLFEYVLNVVAEITRYLDRDFYADWWNSRDMAEFARKWNRPVHLFLQKHIYKASHVRFRWSRHTATFITFLYSSVLHELVMSTSFKKMKFWMFALQMTQLPLMYICRRFGVSKYPFLASVMFWLMILFGLPLLVAIYCGDIIAFRLY